MDLEEIEARNECAVEGQQQFKRPIDRLPSWIRYKRVASQRGQEALKTEDES
jgi:hypothetical protein